MPQLADSKAGRQSKVADYQKLCEELTRDNLTAGLTPEQIDLLARKVYNLLRNELMLEQERRGLRR